MKYAPAGKYLGDQLSSDLKESVNETVKKRVKLAASASYEIRTLVDDKRVEAVGSLSTAFLIYETTVIPMLLTNAETFISMSSKTLKELDKAQLRFLRIVLAIGTGCPIPFLYAFTGTKLMFWRVLEKKLLFIWHVANLGPNTLARETYERECRQDSDIPSLVTETKPYLEELGITNLQSFTKMQYKRLIKQFIFRKNKENIIEMSRKYKKIDIESFRNESFEMKPYFKSLNVNMSRLQMKIDSKMCPTIASNFTRDPRFRAINYLCVGCSVRNKSDPVSESLSEQLNTSRDSVCHLVRCPAYADLRLNLNLREQKDMLTYIQLVIDRRKSEEDN